MVKNLRLIVPALVLAVIAGVLVLSQDPEPLGSGGCKEKYKADVAVRVGSQTIRAEQAISAQQQRIGLSGRACIGHDQGMLFAFEKPGQYSFWMKDMYFPIDIIWMDADRKVIAIEKNVSPSTYPDSFVNKDKSAKYVLELKANRSDSLGIKLGTKVNF